ncbi:hypothetical protein Ddye_011374 [Dipteronia dyeriana]|uniref:Uncharacterized protein n=1 Tax=Dipteronia dyeriana TaxID=168575 RepID=A0AAD9X2D6_9ROSI|nr:hypothetical protein Ddye_011374 [Dipteronia dyeriana]
MGHVQIPKHSKESVNGGHAVKLKEYNCAYGNWQVSRIPCCHDMTTISHYCGRAVVKDKVDELVHNSLTKSAYMQTYVGIVQLIPDQKRRSKVPECIMISGYTMLMNPPPCTIQPDRPKKQRKRESNEAPKVGRSDTVIYKLCHQACHNKRSCQRRNDKEVELFSSRFPKPIEIAFFFLIKKHNLLGLFIDSDILTSALIPHEHFRFLNLIIHPLMLHFDVELGVPSISALDVGCVSRMSVLGIKNLLDVVSLIFELLLMFNGLCGWEKN